MVYICDSMFLCVVFGSTRLSPCVRDTKRYDQYLRYDAVRACMRRTIHSAMKTYICLLLRNM